MSGTNGWRPMETAPKDGTPLLLAYSGGLGVRYGYWDHIGTADWWVADAPHERPTADGWICPYQDFEDPMEPTHWQPLPLPPEPTP